MSVGLVGEYLCGGFGKIFKRIPGVTNDDETDLTFSGMGSTRFRTVFLLLIIFHVLQHCFPETYLGLNSLRHF